MSVKAAETIEIEQISANMPSVKMYVRQDEIPSKSDMEIWLMDDVLQVETITKYADTKEATDYFYALSKANNYIMTERINKNIIWKTKTEKYGDIDFSGVAYKGFNATKKVITLDFTGINGSIDTESLDGRIEIIKKNANGEDYVYDYTVTATNGYEGTDKDGKHG